MAFRTNYRSERILAEKAKREETLKKQQRSSELSPTPESVEQPDETGRPDEWPCLMIARAAVCRGKSPLRLQRRYGNSYRDNADAFSGSYCPAHLTGSASSRNRSVAWSWLPHTAHKITSAGKRKPQNARVVLVMGSSLKSRKGRSASPTPSEPSRQP